MSDKEAKDVGGRPIIELTESQVREVETLAAVLNQDQIADYFGIASNTFAAIRERQPEVFESYKRGKAKAIGSIGSNLIAQAKSGNVSAAIFYLKTQAGWKETTNVDLSSTDGSMSPKPTIVTATDPIEAAKQYQDIMNGK